MVDLPFYPQKNFITEPTNSCKNQEPTNIGLYMNAIFYMLIKLGQN
jgi:hypothetical protein